MLAVTHASPERAALPSSDQTTGEVRIPLRLLNVDRAQGSTPLVLSRREAEQLRDRLAALLLPGPRLLGGGA